jgi:protein TonB
MDKKSNQLQRDIIAILITSILYLPLILWWQNSDLSQKNNNNIESHKIILKISNFKPKPIYETSPFEDDTLDMLDEIMSEKSIIEPKIIKKEIVKKKPKILSKKPKPIYNPLVRTKKYISKKNVSKHKSKKRHKKKIQKVLHKRVDKNLFLSKLKNRINVNKHYPRMARKRRVKGRVSVSFKVTKSGRVSNISIKGSKIFFKSVKDAIHKSFPINTKGVKLPMTVNLILIYKLTG